MSKSFSSEVTLSVLIVNFNGKDFLGPCFDSISKHVSVSYEIIVVDNASQDESIGYIKQNYPTVRVIASPTNLGFTGGNNLAAKYARGRYLLLLNNDTVICSSVDPLIDLMASKNDLGVLGCRLFYGDRRQQESVGYMPSVMSLVLSWTPLTTLFPWFSKFRRTVHGDSVLYKQKYSEVEWVSGAFLLTRADLWHQLKGLDEHYFMYMEDTDYCRRVRDAGNKVSYSAACEVIHFEGAGRSWLGERAVLNSTNSYLVYMRKFHGMGAVIILRMLLSQVFILRSLVHFITFIFSMDANGYEKASAYRRAALRLFFGGVH
jgi:N-acetylglucosaminyl-diphospho-decaprenol L-rhamnosyltransferase